MLGAQVVGVAAGIGLTLFFTAALITHLRAGVLHNLYFPGIYWALAIRTAGTLRACWAIGLAFVVPGVAGLALVTVVQLGLLVCIGVFNPVFATYRLEQTVDDRVARVLCAWTITSNATVAVLTALWGLLAAVAGVRTAIALAGVLMLATPLLLPRKHQAAPNVAPAGSPA